MSKNPNWEDEWKGMPEYISNDMTSFRHIVVHFRCQEDVDTFAKLIGQEISPKMPSLWFPEMKRRVGSDKKYFG